MPTDEERREVAARLREWIAIPWYERPWSRDAMQSLGEMVGAVPGENIVERIADLIDRPTCKNLATKSADELLCSECGEHVDIAYMENADDYHARYCPNCGARVVRTSD